MAEESDDRGVPAEPSTERPQRAKNKGGKKRAAKAAASAKEARRKRSFPASSFEEALILARAIQQFASGQKTRRLTLFDHLQKSPDSGPSRQLISNSNRYGLTKGNLKSEYIELTPDGKTATDPEASRVDQLQAKFRLAIQQIAPFNLLYERFKNAKLPAPAVMRDILHESGYDAAEISECVDTFIVNAKYLSLLRPVAGAERLLPIELITEELQAGGQQTSTSTAAIPLEPERQLPTVTTSSTRGKTDWQEICFYIAPIGDPESEIRKHSDLFLGSIVEPALQEFGLRLIRADQISEAGMIGRQVIEHVVHSKLVIADLSFGNPNVYYELSLRHTCRKPTVQVMRAADKLPFDLDQYRTIRIDRLVVR